MRKLKFNVIVIILLSLVALEWVRSRAARLLKMTDGDQVIKRWILAYFKLKRQL